MWLGCFPDALLVIFSGYNSPMGSPRKDPESTGGTMSLSLPVNALGPPGTKLDKESRDMGLERARLLCLDKQKKIDGPKLFLPHIQITYV